jgi:hypothetical protein
MSVILDVTMKHQTAWRWFAKALGEKASKCDKESDVVARIRTAIFLTYLITNCFIIAGVIRHWNSDQPIYNHNEVPSNLSQTKKESLLKANCHFPKN